MAMPTGMFDDKLQEVMKLLEQKADLAAELGEQPVEEASSKEELMRELLEEDKDQVLVGEQAAMAEFSMMMRQWEALVADYERREAEEAAEQESKEHGES